MIPNRTVLVVCISTVALVAVAFWVQGASGLEAALLPAACVAYVLVVSRVLGWMRAGLALLVLAALMNRYTVPVAGLNLKAEHAAIAICAVLLIWQIVSQRRTLYITASRADLLLGLWVVANAVGSINAPVPASSLKLTLQLAILFAGYILVQQFTRRRADLLLAHGLLVVGLLFAGAYGVLVHLVYPLGLDLGMQINPITKQPTVYGTLYEGNLFGNTVMVGLLWWLVLILLGGERLRRMAIAGIALCTVALEVSLARGAWLAFAATVALALLTYLLFRRRLNLKPQVGARTLAATATAVVLISITTWLQPGELVAKAWNDQSLSQSGASAGSQGKSTSSDIVDRVDSLVNGAQDATVTQRMATVRRATHDWTLHPIVGWGPGSYGQKYINTAYQPDWLGILPLRILHDTGIIGVLLFAGFCVLLLHGAVRALFRTTDRTLRIMLVGHLVGLTALFLAYMVTEGMQLFFPWLLLGLLGATIREARSATA